MQITDGPKIGQPPTVLQSADAVEPNRALAQRDARIAELERALQDIKAVLDRGDLAKDKGLAFWPSVEIENIADAARTSTPAPEHPDTRRLDSALWDWLNAQGDIIQIVIDGDLEGERREISANKFLSDHNDIREEVLAAMKEARRG